MENDPFEEQMEAARMIGRGMVSVIAIAAVTLTGIVLVKYVLNKRSAKQSPTVEPE